LMYVIFPRFRVLGRQEPRPSRHLSASGDLFGEPLDLFVYGVPCD
jgi:hypothetical protein